MFFIQENQVWNVGCEMAIIWTRSKCVKVILPGPAEEIENTDEFMIPNHLGLTV